MMVSPDQTSMDINEIDEGQLEEAHTEFTMQEAQKILDAAVLPEVGAIDIGQIAAAEAALLRSVDLMSEQEVGRALFTRTNMRSDAFEAVLRTHMDSAIQKNPGFVAYSAVANTLLRHFMCVGIIVGAQNRAVQA